MRQKRRNFVTHYTDGRTAEQYIESVADTNKGWVIGLIHGLGIENIESIEFEVTVRQRAKDEGQYSVFTWPE